MIEYATTTSMSAYKRHEESKKKKRAFAVAFKNKSKAAKSNAKGNDSLFLI